MNMDKLKLKTSYFKRWHNIAYGKVKTYTNFERILKKNSGVTYEYGECVEKFKLKYVEKLNAILW